MDIHPDDVTFVSSDTHKLVRYINSEKAPGIEASFVLAPKPANILKSLISKDMAEVKISFDSKGCIFRFSDYVLTAMCDALDAQQVRKDWDTVFQSFSLG